MFKIIKTSTYKKMQSDIALLEKNLAYYVDLQKTHYRVWEQNVKEKRDLKTQLHTLTAKKLPIKKSKKVV